MLEATAAPNIGNTIPAAFLKNPLREIISLFLFILIVFKNVRHQKKLLLQHHRNIYYSILGVFYMELF